MKIIFLGYAVDEKLAGKLSGASVAGNKMQVHILENLFNKVEELEIITVYPIALFPKDRHLWITKKRISIGKELTALRIPFLNLPMIKQLSQILSVYIAAANYIKKNRDCVILPFNMYPQVGAPAVWLKKKYAVKVIPVLADLPIDDNYQRKGVRRLLRGIFDNRTKKYILQSDKVIVLNQHARDSFAPGKECLVMEGGVDLKEYQHLITKGKANEKNIVYSGSLSEYSGVRELADAMKLVSDPEIILDIYGEGTLRGYIKQRCGKNIRYHNKVSNEEMLRLQREAWLLINPRPVDDRIAQVTFPSKLFEYMMSRTPVLTTRLNGLPEEYLDKLLIAENNSPKELADCINRISRMDRDKLEQLAEKAEQFIRAEKQWCMQVNKIIEFMK